jgi:uncharacterized membrane protein YdbT with pleckstrin-like domain
MVMIESAATVDAGPEYVVWSEKASMRDFWVNPFHWFFTLITFGVYFVFVWLTRLYTRYTLTNERLKVTSGLLAEHVDEVELFRVKDTKVYQSILDRLVGLGTVTVQSADATGEMVLKKLPMAIARREELRTLSNKARDMRGVRTVMMEQ